MGTKEREMPMNLVYHGSTDIIPHPLVDYGRLGLDFGRGFYLTSLPEQAQKWADRVARQRLTQPVVNVYELDIACVKREFRCLEFTSYDKQWLDFIARCRTSYDPTPEWDLIEGGIANDRVIDTVEGYINGTIDTNHALQELAKHQPNQQICILNQVIIDKYLRYKESL